MSVPSSCRRWSRWWRGTRSPATTGAKPKPGGTGDRSGRGVGPGLELGDDGADCGLDGLGTLDRRHLDGELLQRGQGGADDPGEELFALDRQLIHLAGDTVDLALELG